MLAKLILPLGFLFASATSSLAACPGQAGKVIFSDDFSDDSGGWDLDQGEQISRGALNVNTDPKRMSDGSLNITFNAAEGDFCAVFAFPSVISEPDNSSYVALLVLATDYKNRYQYNIDTDGEAWVNKYSAGVSLPIVPPIKMSAIKTEPGAENTLRVVVKDQKLTFYVNGEKVKALKAQVPDGNNRFGFFAGLEKKAPADPQAFQLKSYSLTEAQ
jgi:hypothetical protein